jgi:outer membrane protein assembly factor BamB
MDCTRRFGRTFPLVLTFLAACVPAWGPGVHAADWPQFLGPSRDGVLTRQNLPDKFPPGGPKEVWSVEVGVGFGGASVAGGHVYLLDREDDARDVLRCLSLRDGSEVWRRSYEVSGKLSFPGSRSTPTVDEKLIFTVGGFGHVAAFDRQTGRPVWSFTLKERFNSDPPNWGFTQSPLVYKDWVIIAPMGPQVGLTALDR